MFFINPIYIYSTRNKNEICVGYHTEVQQSAMKFLTQIIHHAMPRVAWCAGVWGSTLTLILH